MQPLASLAGAVVVHSRFMEERVAQFFKGPILRLFLPSDQKIAPSADDMARWRSETASKERCQFATFGHIGRPKCLETIIQAIAQSPMLRAKSLFVVAGHPGDKEYVRETEALVAKLGLTKQVSFEYSVTDERLLAIKNDSDVFVNLRFPNTEGASGSLVEMLNAGRPVIAYRAGCYADVPQDAAVLIERGDGLDAVTSAMEELLADPARRVAVGAAGQDYVRAQDSRRYVGLFKTFVLDIQPELKRRGGFLVPARDALTWSACDVEAADAGWFGDLTQARRSLLLLERDAGAHSPEIFLSWPMDDLIAFTARVLLNPVSQSGMAQLLAGYAQRLGRWSFYRLISKLCFYQTLCAQAEIGKADVASYAERVTDIAFWGHRHAAAAEHPELDAVSVRAGARLGAGRAGQLGQAHPPGRAGGHRAARLPQQRRIPPDLPRPSDGRCRGLGAPRSRAVDRLAQPGAAAARLAVGADVKFNEDNPTTEALLGRLWHRRDAQGRWSDGRTGDLRFMLPEDAARHGATLMLRLRVAGTKITGQRRIVAHCNRRELGAITLPNDAPQSWALALPSSIHSKEGVSLLLIADQDFSPASSGQSADKRSLGLMLIEGRLTVGTSGTEAPERELAGATGEDQ